MKEVTDKLKCGECGGETFMLHSRAGGDSGRFGGGGQFRGSLVVTCLGCGKKTVIGGAPPALEVDDEGTLCGGWGEKRS